MLSEEDVLHQAEYLFGSGSIVTIRLQNSMRNKKDIDDILRDISAEVFHRESELITFKSRCQEFSTWLTNN
jgi:hypothetical protein